MTTDLLGGLNPKQKEAVLHTEGPLLILAGAGSGKTRVIAHRMAYLVQTIGIPLETILAVTFTNKAAQEMKGRVESLLGKVGQRGNLATFHSTCLKILRQHGHAIGMKNDFVIYDTDDQLSLMKLCLAELSIDGTVYPPRRFLGLISQLKNQMISPEQYVEGVSASLLQEKLKQVYPLYQAKLAAFSAVDFDDLIGRTITLFEGHPDLLHHFQERFQYLMIDEYQDTNYAQYRLTRLWVSQKRRNICVVGDDDQSIYSFRGADAGNILKFERDYPDAKVVILDQNYRSTSAILNAASMVISKNHQRKPKKLWTDKGAGEPIVVARVADEGEEAVFVRDTIEAGRRKGDPLSHFCILYRTHAQSRVLEERLRNRGIPYVIFGGIRFYERKEIKDLIAYLRVIFAPEDAVSLKRIINVPPRGIGEVTVQKLAAYATSKECTLYEAIGHVVFAREGETDAGMPGLKAGKQGLTAFFHLIERMRVEMKKMPLGDFVRFLIEQTHYIDYLSLDGGSEPTALAGRADVSGRSNIETAVANGLTDKVGRVENVLEFITAAEEVNLNGVTDPLDPIQVYEAFLDQIALIANDEGGKGSDGEGVVTLMTLHGAKGLEFETVFMVGMEEGVFPHLRSLTDTKEMEEERRLCYVGMTRAKSHLYLTHADSRRLYGTTHWNPPSRFLKDIGEGKGVQRCDGSDEFKQDEPDETRYERIPVDDAVSPDVEAYYNTPFQNRAGLGKEGQGQDGMRYHPGMWVRHPVFGKGQVQRSSGGEKVTIHFASVGIKQLALKYAKLTPI